MITVATRLTDVLASVQLPDLMIIEGQRTGASGDTTFANVTPIDGRVLNHVASAQAADVDAAVRSARRAFESNRWNGAPPREKKRVLHRLAELMEIHAEELALLETLDTGKPIRDAIAVDVPLAIGTTRYYAEALDKIYGEVGPSPPGRLSIAVHEPLGVIGAIVPWNFPLHMAMWKVAPALAMGNSVVLKPAEQSPLTALRLAELALEAGLPPGVLNVVPGLGPVAGKALALHDDVDMIAFTGSGAVGRLLMQYAGQSNLKRVSLELGGKSPQIVFADCPDLDAAAQAAAWGVFYNQGQVCTAASRLLVERSIREDFIERVAAITRTIRPEDPLDPETRFGAMVSEAQMHTVLEFIDGAIAEGARTIIAGGRSGPDRSGFYVSPAIFEVGRAMTLARKEVFGPVLAVIPFDGENEALGIANDTPYGLAAGLWTSDMGRAHRMAARLRAGLVWVNGWDACDITMPFGGFKQSGSGRDRSLHALHKYSDLKSISFSYPVQA